MTTPTEKIILQRRRAKESGDVLRPILERLLEKECIPEDEEDFRFLNMLARARAVPRTPGVFSPSMLGSCVRQAYFAKTGEEKHAAFSTQTNGYFLKGNFVHFQWQFALWKAHRAGLLELATVVAESADLDFYGNGTRPAVELRVISKSGDFGGTIDAVAKIVGPYYVIDFKSINQYDFMRTIKRGIKEEYRVQIVGYAILLNGSHQFSFVVKNCILLSENKAGPLSGANSPLGLHEQAVSVDDYKDEVRKKLTTLREYVAKEQIPSASCVSTRHNGFQECAFNRHCRAEVKAIQQEREREAEGTMRNWTVNRVER